GTVSHAPRDHTLLHYFPTRRSSDLRVGGRGTSLPPSTNTGDPGLRRRRSEAPSGLVARTAQPDRAVRSRPPRTADRKATGGLGQHRKSTRLNSSHDQISYAVFFLKK